MIKREELTDPTSCMSRARDDEMTFVLLGRDIAAPDTIIDWCRRRVRLGKNTWGDPQIAEAVACAAKMWADRTAVVRVTVGSFVGALVEVHFVNKAGNLDGRFAEDFRSYHKGRVMVVSPTDVESIPKHGA